MPLSYAADIKTLFRSKDINAMKNFGRFDLSLYEDVKENSDEILKRLQDGSMPCDGAWPNDDIVKFQKWIEEGRNP